MAGFYYYGGDPPVYQPAYLYGGAPVLGTYTVSSPGAYGGGGGKGFRELVEKIQRNVEVLHREITTGKSPGKKTPARPLQVAKLEVIPQLQELQAQIKALETELSQLRKEKALAAQLDADAEEEAVVTMLLL